MIYYVHLATNTALYFNESLTEDKFLHVINLNIFPWNYFYSYVNTMGLNESIDDAKSESSLHSLPSYNHHLIVILS